MEESSEQSEPTVLFTDEDGNEKEMLVIFTFELKETTYAVLIEKENPEEDGVLMKVIEEEDEVYLSPIEDDDEWERALETYEKLADK